MAVADVSIWLLFFLNDMLFSPFVKSEYECFLLYLIYRWNIRGRRKLRRRHIFS